MYSVLQRKIGQHDDRVSLKVGRSFLVATRRASATCSRRVYRVSAYARDFLIKNIGLYFHFSSSLNKTRLIETFDTAK